MACCMNCACHVSEFTWWDVVIGGLIVIGLILLVGLVIVFTAWLWCKIEDNLTSKWP